MEDRTVERDPEAGLSDEDRQRANRIGVLNARLWRLEELLGPISGPDARQLRIGIATGTATLSAFPDVTMRGVEAERLLAHLIDETKGELQALLL